ncbi:Transcriptional adapter 2 [Termitomyces sp. J132]|nr:Transcriptional adapter 2 [Termitomyces sp. J132]
MTVTQRKPQHLPDEIQTVNEPGVQYQCDSCKCDLTHTIRIKCADPVCQPEDGVDICPSCFCAGKEFGRHKRGHAYRVIEINSYPIFTEDWGADEELLLITGLASHGFGNWKKIAEHVGTRTKEEVEKHYTEVYVESPNWPLPAMGRDFEIDPEEFHERKRRRISAMNAMAPPPPKVAPTSAPGNHEIATFLPGRLEFEHELDNDAEDLVKDLEYVEEPTQPPPYETEESLKFKLTLMETYMQRVEKRLEGKALIFNRGLLEYKKMQAAEKKRPREERDIIQRLRPFAKLQTAEDYEAFASDILYEAMLRKRILELQTYRRLGLMTAADIDKYEADLAKRTQAKSNPPRDHHNYDRSHARSVSRHSTGPDPRTPKLPASAPPVRRLPAPLNLANSPSLHLLTPGEQTLCSQLRILPKPYLVIKETLVREYARRGGKLRRREARDLVKIDVNKTSRIWDFLVQAGFLKINNDPITAATVPAPAIDAKGPSASPLVNGSPTKNTHPRAISSPLPPPPPPMATVSSSGSHNGSLYNASLASTPSFTGSWPPPA